MSKTKRHPLKRTVTYVLLVGAVVWLLGSGSGFTNSVMAQQAIPEAAGETATAQRPNIILIFADDLGYGDIGAYGATTINTPNIDRMAEQGAMFDEFYAVSPVCTPSRAGLLTGRYPIRQGIHEVFHPESFQGMDPQEITRGGVS